MRKLLYLLLLIPLISFSQETKNLLNRKIEDKLIKKIDGITYYRGKPYTGEIYERYHENGQLGAIGNYKDGKKTFLESYYENGKVAARINFKDGKKNGLQEWHMEEGYLWETQIYKDGIRNGLRETYHENGLLLQRMNYKDGKLNGLEEAYDVNGKLMWIKNYKDGIKNGLEESYHSNGNLSSRMNYKDGISNGLFEWWDENGRPEYHAPYINDTFLYDVNVYDLEPMVKLFLKDCELNNIKLSSDYKITSTFEPLDDGVLALSSGIFNDEEIIIKVNPKDWSKASDPKRWYILYHELGHDVLNLQHGQGGKMMFNFTENDYTWKDFFTDKDYMFKSMSR
jgi:antitoxin component YwqK of YwqJK toxin-antitoxin module